MPTDAVLSDLVDLTKRCTAWVTTKTGDNRAGAGFFVDSDLLLTCRHVVGEPPAQGQHHVSVAPFCSEKQFVGTVLPLPEDVAPEDLPDLALVKVPLDRDDPRRQAVVLHRDLVQGEFNVFGYPTNEYHKELPPGLEAPALSGHASEQNDTGEPQVLLISEGQIKKGFSGGPVLSRKSGVIVGVMEYSEDLNIPKGGGAIPIARAVEAFPELRKLVEEPPPAVRKWRNKLGPYDWAGLGLAWNPRTQFDIYLSGDRGTWEVGLAPRGHSAQMTVHDLGDGIGEVLLNWARNTGRRDLPEVKLLGELLSAALFPPEIAMKLPPPAGRRDEPIVVRLHLDAAGPLSGLPWEFVTVPAAPGQFLACEEGYAFTRVDTGRGQAPPGNPADLAAPRVLTAVVQPENTEILPSLVIDKVLHVWPKAEEIDDQLGEAVGRLTGHTQRLVNPEQYEFGDIASECERDGTRFDVIHYTGFGYRVGRGIGGPSQFRVACSDGYQDLAYGDVSELLKSFARLKPRLVVLEFGPPTVKLSEWDEPIGPSLASALRDLPIQAVLCTRAVHPKETNAFNQRFYQLLGEGNTVEHAVQMARDRLRQNNPVDCAGFGWFALVTGSRSGLRFVDSGAGGGGGDERPARVGLGDIQEEARR